MRDFLQTPGVRKLVSRIRQAVKDGDSSAHVKAFQEFSDLAREHFAEAHRDIALVHRKLAAVIETASRHREEAKARMAKKRK